MVGLDGWMNVCVWGWWLWWVGGWIYMCMYVCMWGGDTVVMVGGYMCVCVCMYVSKYVCVCVWGGETVVIVGG